MNPSVYYLAERDNRRRGGAMVNHEPEMEIVHLLRAVTVEFGMLQGEFAAGNGMHRRTYGP